ncbi:FlgD immunoglobulin-like domain containing protein [Caldithrix abyssi]
MRNVIFLLIFFTTTQLFAFVTGHYPFTSIGFNDGTYSSNYSVPPYGRQATGSTNFADYDIISTDATDLFVVFDYDTYGKTVYLVYTTDGTAPTKTNGTVVNCSFDKINNSNNWWWYGNIPSFSAKTIIKYVFYISDGALNIAYGRIAADGYKTSWTEGDSYFGYAVSSDANTTYHTVYFLGDELHDWRSNEQVAIDGNSNFYISWDDITLFVGIFTTDLDFTKIDPDRFNIGIDNDPGGSNGDATTGFAGYNFDTFNDGFHKLDYIVQVSTAFNTNVKVFNGVDGSFDLGTDKSYVTIISQRYIEIGIPWADIGGRPSSNWGTILWTSNHYDSWVMSSFPTSNPTGSASPPLDVVEYHLFNSAGSGVSPSTDGADNSLPVTLNSFTSTVSGEAILLQWATQSEIDVLGFEIQRALDESGPFETIATYKDHPELKASGSTSAETAYRFIDQNVQPNFTYWYKLISHDLDGSRQTFGPISATVQKDGQNLQPIAGNTPTEFMLEQNFPNPFNGSTQIAFSIPAQKEGSVNVQLNVFDINGKLIDRLINQTLSAGTYQVKWDGRDLRGNKAPSGVYIYQLRSNNFVFSKKMLLVQ